MKKLRRFCELEAKDRLLFLRAIAALAIARIRLASSSFEKLAADFTGDTEPAGIADPELLTRIGFAVRAAAANVPWRADCFPQALAARTLLKRHGLAPTVHLGVERIGDDILNGHAWLSCGDTIVVGGDDLARYTEIHRFSG